MMERPRARPRNFFNTEKSDKEADQEQNGNETPEKRPRRDRDRTRSGARESTVENDSDLDVAELNRRIDRLQRDLTRRDRELDDERLENEKAMDKIKKLERDKVELKREVEDFRLEAEEYKRTLDDYKVQLRSRGGSYSPAGSESGHGQSDPNGNNYSEARHSASKNYELIINQKNRELSQLIEDLERLDDDKSTLQDKLTQLTDNLDDATKQIEAMANEHFKLKSKLEKAGEKVKLLEEEKTVLQIKERDLMGSKERHEQYLDNLCKAVDVRVDIWKKMMLEKDEEIGRLNAKVETLMSQIPNMQLDSERSTIRHLQAKLSEREEQISQLNDELSRATDEINSNIKLIEKLQSRLSASEDVENIEKLVKSLQTKIKRLEEKLIKKDQQLKSAEREAEVESSEHAALLARIHAYETGEYGLSEAISEIKDFKNQIRIRDKQVESVTQDINILQMQVHDLEDENEMLRDKLGLERSVDVSRETKRYQKSRKNEVIALRSKVNQMEDNLVQLKTMNYSLRKQLAQFELNQQQHQLMDPSQGVLILAERDRPDGGSISSPKPTSAVGRDTSTVGASTVVNFKPEDWKHKYEIILEENTALRKGLQEILDAMHKLTDEGTSEIIIQSPVLEDLLREMSARGIINYPYPVTSFHLKVCNLEGKCAQLREDLHRIRQEEKECRAELMEAKATIRVYEEKLHYMDRHRHEERMEEQEKELTDQEIQTDDAYSPPVLDNDVTQETVSQRIIIEKMKLGEMMDDLKQRILEMEDSRRIKDVPVTDKHSESTGMHGRSTPSQMEFHDTLVVARDTIKLLEEKLLDVGQFMEDTKDGNDDYNGNLPPSNVDVEVQTDDGQFESPVVEEISEKCLRDRNALSKMMDELKQRVRELESNLKAKDELIHGFQIFQPVHPENEHTSVFSDLHEALGVARETITSLQDRLKSKDESIVQYRKLLAEVRTEMTNASERHVQEMRQLQLTIHQQQQAFTRMKSTLSQPVKDTMSIEGTIKDQLTRIHELEDEVSQLQHTLANVASQLTAARSDAHRWRCTAEMRLKEVEQTRDHFSSETVEEVQNLRRKLKDTQMKLEKAEEQLDSTKSIHQRDSLSDLVSILKNELEEKDKQIGMYLKTLKSSTFNEKSHIESLLSTKEKEIDVLKEDVSKHLKTISSLQLRLSKTKAVNYKTGVSSELEELRLKYRDLQDEKLKLENDIHELHSKRDEEESRKIKTAESVARWDEGKKWKKNNEKLMARAKELELENERLEKLITTFKSSIRRLEKEKMIMDSRLKSHHSIHGSSMSKSSLENISEGSAPSTSYHQNYILAQGEIAKLQMELQDSKELVEKTEFEGREEIEKLKMEIKCLKERIVTQERQLTAYEVAQKGDPQVVQEIQKMAAHESEFQKEVIRLEEENLHLRLQIEQLQLETPRLRDRVQHLQKIVDAMKADKSLPGQKTGTLKSLTQRPLGELERTISALKQVIDKLQSENKKFKVKTDYGNPRAAASERLKSSVGALMDEKRTLLDRVQSLEQETEKYQRMYMDKCSIVDSYESRLQDAEKRAKSTEMKLKTFLDDRKTVSPRVIATSSSSACHSFNTLTHKVQKMEEELLHKSKVLSTAKQALKEAERAISTSSAATSSKSYTQVNPPS